ncbi:DUF86 domain-containing protein [Patescibacteria group bacterium]|nr:DUF86 domain-containing protein [Patescibacteria group bacterium]
MKKEPWVYIADILESIERIETYIEKSGVDKVGFLKDVQLQDAVARRFEIIGEAVKRLEDNFRESYSGIPWKQMAGMRNVMIREYDRIDWNLVWKTIVDNLPRLKESLKKIVK